MALQVRLNGQDKVLDGLEDGVGLSQVVTELGLKADRIAVELNGEIARRGGWELLLVHAGDKLEIVHFVGGGSGRTGSRGSGRAGGSHVALSGRRSNGR